jgi:hypothetical protein
MHWAPAADNVQQHLVALTALLLQLLLLLLLLLLLVLVLLLLLLLLLLVSVLLLLLLLLQLPVTAQPSVSTHNAVAICENTALNCSCA